MTIKLKGSTDGSVSFTAPADTSPSGSDITLTLPTTAGSANQFVKNSGTAGTLEYSSMVETSTGVGIGTTSPAEKLEVAGNLQLDAANAGLKIKAGTTGNRGAVDFTFNTDSTVYGSLELDFDDRATDGLKLTTGAYPITLQYHSSQYFRVKDETTERMRINSSGNVGIGTTSPDSKVHIVDGLGGGQLLVANNDTNSTEKYGSFGGVHYTNSEQPVLGIAAQSSSVANPVLIGGGLGEFNAATDVKFYTASNNTTTTGTQRMIINSSGNVGIGDTGPDTLLDVGGTTTFRRSAGNDQRVEISSTSAGHFLTAYSASGNPKGLIIQNADTSQVITLNAGGSERMRINSSGNVGIGLSAAATKLEVNGDIGIGRSAGGYTFREVVGGGERAGIKSNASNELVFLTGGAAERLRIMGDGDIRFKQFTTSTPGFGNSTTGMAVENLSSGAALYVSRSDAGPFLVNRNSNGTVVDLRRSGSQKGNIQVTTSTATFNSASDYRLKENVAALSDGITRLKQLNPSRFNFIEEPDTTVDGFIAHEVQAVVPEAVTGTHNEVDDDGNPVMQGMDYGKVTPLLTAALQEAIAKIETLETKVAALEAGS